MRPIMMAWMLVTAAGCSAGAMDGVGEVSQSLLVDDQDGDHITKNGMDWECFLELNWFEKNNKVREMPSKPLAEWVRIYNSDGGDDIWRKCTLKYLSKLAQASSTGTTPDMVEAFGNDHWTSAPLSLADQQRITAGMLALVNTQGIEVDIWARSPLTSRYDEAKPWDKHFNRLEGAYWGNMFTPVANSDDPRELNLAAGPDIKGNDFQAMRCGNEKRFTRYFRGHTNDHIGEGTASRPQCDPSFTGYDSCAGYSQVVTTWVPKNTYPIYP